METTLNEKQESEGNMFELAKDLEQKAAEVALLMGDSQDAVEIPGTDGQVLVRYGSAAYLERKNAKGIMMVPLSVKVGAGGEKLYAVCTK